MIKKYCRHSSQIQWLFPDFPISKDFPWCFTEFPDFSLTLKNKIFPDFSLTAGNPDKVDPHCDAYRRQKSSIRSCIGNKYVYVYEVGCLIVALKSWYLYFLPDTPETTFSFRNGMLRNLLDVFTVHDPPWHGLGPVSISDKTPIRRLIVRSREVSKLQDLCLKLSDHSEIWQAHPQQCYHYVSVKNFKTMRKHKTI